MKRIRTVSLYSGSVGNAFAIQTEQGTILIDAGKNAKRLCMALTQAGISPDEIRAIFVTHEHSDHISALPVFLKKHPIPVHIQIGSAYRLANDPVVAPLLCPHPPIFTETVCGLTVTSFPTPHDSRASVGFRIEADPDYAIGYATDIGFVSRDVENGLTGCTTVILESNHDIDMLMEGPYPYDLKKRISSRRGHLSNSDSAEFAAHLCRCGTKQLMLAHLSQENNTPEIAYDECISSIGNDRIEVAVAAPDAVTELVWEV